MARHGSRGRYNQGCRCGACTEANTAAARARRERLRDEAEPSFLVGGQPTHPPARPVALSPLQERSTEAAFAAAAIRGTSEAAQRRRDRLEAEALAADLLDRQDRLRPARAPAAGDAALARYGIVTPGWAAAWTAASVLRRGRSRCRQPRPGASDAPSDAALARYTEDLRRWISGQGPPPGSWSA